MSDNPIGPQEFNMGDVSGQNINIGGTYQIIGDMSARTKANHIPFMAPDMPSRFVNRPKVFAELLKIILAADGKQTIGITSALQGAGGFGKTTLAIALCHDERVQKAYPDGVMWVTLGESGAVMEGLIKLYAELTGLRPRFVDTEDAANQLAGELKQRRCLMVIDDVWEMGHLRPFLQGGETCTRLITTRQSDIVMGSDASGVQVDDMEQDEAVDLLLAGIEETPVDREPFVQLATQLGEWALLLEIANAMLREEIRNGADLAKALNWVNDVLNEEGVHGVELENEDERKRSATSVLAASFRRLELDETQRLCQLGIFSDDANVPLSSVKCLWGLSKVRNRAQLVRFSRLGFIRYDAKTETFRVHDVIRELLLSRLDDIPSFHARLIDNYGDKTHLPDDYAWDHYAYHLL
ncbi:MAG: NB-ARC domain-containing protein, partial [Chloroflexota bacterium]